MGEVNLIIVILLKSMVQQTFAVTFANFIKSA
jgi:hypothetical protein